MLLLFITRFIVFVIVGVIVVLLVKEHIYIYTYIYICEHPNRSVVFDLLVHRITNVKNLQLVLAFNANFKVPLVKLNMFFVYNSVCIHLNQTNNVNSNNEFVLQGYRVT